MESARTPQPRAGAKAEGLEIVSRHPHIILEWFLYAGPALVRPLSQPIEAVGLLAQVNEVVCEPAVALSL